ncbi:hypothetical protein PBI_FLOOF_45 [Microbacterium phage Floof]|uniref:Uncharacterized protein n=1 Tax=Microbacterium phage Floof TaxID=2201433 RepID=A0A2Z4Q4B1_9CAUD|nr:hypothetical protein PBI_FLOOF_45 [Microbacterium phage Floof]
MSAERDGRRVSSALSEARTLLTRAETSLGYLRRSSDPAAPEVRAALEELVERLKPFRRIKGGCTQCGAKGQPHKRKPDDPLYRRYWDSFTCEVPRG